MEFSLQYLDGSTSNSIAVKQELKVYIRAFAVIIDPFVSVNHICMRLELHGVGKLSSTSTFSYNSEKNLVMIALLEREAISRIPIWFLYFHHRWKSNTPGTIVSLNPRKCSEVSLN